MTNLGNPLTVGLNPTIHQQKLSEQRKEEIDNEDITPLHVAVYHNKVEFIEPLITTVQINMNEQDTHGFTALMIAAQQGHLESIEKLLRIGASKSITNNNGQTAHLVALRHGKTKAAQLIIDSLANKEQYLNLTDISGYNVLHYCGYCNDDEIFKTIEEYCYIDDMISNSINPSCSTPIHIAAMNGSVKTLKWLLDHQADPTVENCMGQSPLLLAIKNKHYECIDLLLDVSNTHIPDNYGQLALHYAAAVGLKVEYLKKISDKYPNALTKVDTNGNYPFHHAVKSNNVEVLNFFFNNEDGKQLLQRRNSNGLTPLMLSVACGAIESYNYLKKLNSDCYAKSMSGTTPFLMACAYGQMEMVKMLFKNDPSVIEDCDNSKNTAFHYSVQNNRIEVLKWLKTVGGELLKKANIIGETPLHIACLTGQRGISELLINYGLSIASATTSGKTPFHYAVLGGHLQLVRVLRKEAPVECFAPDKNKLTPLHYCCVYGMVHLIDELLISAPQMLNARDGCGRTPLHVAAVMNDPLCIRKLLEHGCDKEQLDIRKLTAHQSSINRGYIHCYELIGGETKFTPIKKVKMLSDFILQDENMLRVKNNEVIEVYWEHRKGWAVGGINGKYGLFPLSKATTVSLDKADQERIQMVLANKKMVKKSQDRKNRSASVAFKDGQAKKAPTTADPTLLGLQQALPPQNTGKRATRRRAAPAADV